jgi:hypothetical protein
MTRSLFSILTLALLLSACGSDGGMGPDEMDPIDDGGNTGTRVVKANPSFSDDILDIFTRKGCAASSCHGAAAQAGLNLSSGVAYGNLVNVQSTQSTLMLVAPGDPVNSYLVQKVEGTASFGSTMPLGGSALDNIDRTNLRNWIASGAMNN